MTESLAKKLNKNAFQNVFYICKFGYPILIINSNKKLFYLKACFWGFRDICKSLLSKYQDLDVNHINGGSKWTPLHAATFMENGPLVMILLDQGAEVDGVDKYGR